MDERADGRNVDRVSAVGRTVQEVTAHPFGNRLGVIATHVRRRHVRVFAAGSWEDPVEIGVEQRCRESTGWASATWLVGPALSARRGIGAQQALRQPQREPLLPDSRGAVEQEARREGPSINCSGEARPQAVVAYQGGDVERWHTEICRWP